MKTSKRIKTPAATVVANSREEVDAFILQIGEAQRRRDELQTAMNDELSEIKARYEELAAPHAAVIQEFGGAVHIWCEAHRSDLTKEGRTKTAKLGNGEVSWRMRPPKVAVRNESIVLAALRGLGLDRFIRRKEEIDRNAILGEPSAVSDVRGIQITQGEDFVIKPFSTELEEVAS